MAGSRPGFAGIRTLIHDQPDPDWLLRPEVSEGLALLERSGVPFDVISVQPRHLSHVPVLSERHQAPPVKAAIWWYRSCICSAVAVS